MAHKNIVSYYSEDEYNLDAVYSIDYPDGVDIGFEIETAYEELSEQGEQTNELSCILEYLIGQGLDIKYDTLGFDVFNCDYGIFKEV
jgi:hypothetical protein